MARSTHSVGVVIAAGGKGRRFGRKTPKQFSLLGGKPILERTLRLFNRIECVHQIVVVTPKQHLPRVRTIVKHARIRKVVAIVPGGRERQDSVWEGLTSFPHAPKIVLVHDAVRPLVSKRMVEGVVRAARNHSAAAVGVRVKDTLKTEGRKGYYTGTLNRDTLWAIQTPQGFEFDLLLRAHTAARRTGFIGTDESMLMERIGVSVRIIEGTSRNIKITTPEDLKLAEYILK